MVGLLTLVNSLDSHDSSQDSAVSEDLEESEPDQYEDIEQYDESNTEAVEIDNDEDLEESEFEPYEWNFTSSYETYLSWNDSPSPSSIKAVSVEAISTVQDSSSSTSPTPTLTATISPVMARTSDTTNRSPLSTSIDRGPLWSQPTKVVLQPENTASGYGFSKRSMSNEQYFINWKMSTVCLLLSLYSCLCQLDLFLT
ncbi:hypothetical protein K7432_003090 [Basidiobolus ranarum]|uniref:Uncharacterized protein n=1 Tax=Basidiobolus ranarum TaxID=34480 RepID=A0ABR2X0N4_9FUNG